MQEERKEEKAHNINEMKIVLPGKPLVDYSRGETILCLGHYNFKRNCFKPQNNSFHVFPSCFDFYCEPFKCMSDMSSIVQRQTLKVFLSQGL